jgi:glutathione peroxidase
MLGAAASSARKGRSVTKLHDLEARAIDGELRSLGAYAGQVALVVNVASRCGLTPQYQQLEELYAKYRERGLAVLAFPCNQFGAQEPGTESEIREFCSARYGVSFPLFAKLEVNGPGRHPLYAFLAEQPTQPDGAGDIRWNFAKFVVDRSGNVAARFAPTVAPDAPELVAVLERLL